MITLKKTYGSRIIYINRCDKDTSMDTPKRISLREYNVTTRYRDIL